MKTNRVFIFLLGLLAFCACNHDTNIPYSHPEYFDSIFFKAENISHLPKGERSFISLDSAFNKFPKPGIKDLYKKYDFKISFIIDNDEITNHSMVYVDSMFAILGTHINEQEFTKEYANTLLKKGTILMWEKDYSSAFDCIYKARQVFGQTQDSCLLSAYTLLLARISYQQGKDLDAVKYYTAAIAEMRSCPDGYRTFKLTQAKLDDIGLSYNRRNMPDSALYYYDSAIHYIDANKSRFPKGVFNENFVAEATGVVYGNMGDAYLKKGDTAKGEASYKKDINIKLGYDHGDGQCTELKLVNLYLNQNRLVETGNELDRLKISLDSFPDYDNLLKWYRLKLGYIDKTGQTKDAYQYIKPYLKLRDSLSAVRQMPQPNMEEEFEHVKDLYNLGVLEKENTLKNKYLIIVLSCSVLAIIFALLLWYNWKRSNKLNGKVIKQNSEMRLTLNSLTESQKENTQMMQIVAHDLKNPISSMISITSLILDNNNLPDDDKEMMELMQTSSINAIEMIDDLLNINTTAAGMTKEPVDIDVLLRYCVDLLQFKASGKKQHISLESEKVTLLINQEKIWRVISNLLVNAIKFSREGASISVTGKTDLNGFRIIVEDKGIGIPEKFKYSIFEMFSDAQRPGTSGEKSYGMGLAISRQIVEAHGGKIWYESEEGIGTRFIITLPLPKELPPTPPAGTEV